MVFVLQLGTSSNPGALRYGRFSPTLDLVDLFEDYTDDGTGKSAPIKTRADGNEANVPNVQLEGNVKSTKLLHWI